MPGKLYMLPLSHLLLHGGFCPLLPALQISIGQGTQHPALSMAWPRDPQKCFQPRLLGKAKRKSGAGSSWWQSAAPATLWQSPGPTT